MKTRILVICASGIGNSVLFTPTLRLLREEWPEAEIVFLATSPALAAPITGSGLVDEIVVLDNRGGVLQKARLMYDLRRRRFDYSICAFPSNKMQFNLFAFAVGARKRVTHAYAHARLRTLGFLQNVKVPADPTLHDVEQNLKLLPALGVNVQGRNPRPLYHLSAEERNFAQEFFTQHRMTGPVLGIHPGGKAKDDYKRWPPERFAELLEQVHEAGNLETVLFGGPEDEPAIDSIRAQLGFEPLVVRGRPLGAVAALIERCAVFLGTDSGLGHIAAALGVPTATILGPAIHTRVAPYGEENVVIRSDMGCSPCFRYPFYATDNAIACQDVRCLASIQPKQVLAEIERMLRVRKQQQPFSGSR